MITELQYMVGHFIKESNGIIKTDWDIQNCIFHGNSSGLGGGGVKFTGSLPYYFFNNSMNTGNNTAPYVPNQLSFPSYLAFMRFNKSNIAADLVDCSKFEETCVLYNEVSGNPLSAFLLEVREAFDQVYHEEGIFGKIEISIGKSFGISNYLEGPIQILLAQDGQLKFDSILAVAKPGSKNLLTVRVFVLSLEKYSSRNQYKSFRINHELPGSF